jgi:cell division septation protein DedD
MQDQTTWKAHSLTLFVFLGIVILCSIFFILGMLVGRQQGQKLASIASAEAAPLQDSKPPISEQELTFFDSVGSEKQAAGLDPDPELRATAPLRPAPESAASVVNYQVGALRRSADADELLDEMKAKGFRSFILAPAPGDANPFFRVQVGPFASLIEAEDARKRLEEAGYKPILRK